MDVFEMTSGSIPKITELMCTIQPDWWDYEGAYGQLSGTEESIRTVGWYLGENKDTPKGWILCRELIGYRALELECSGFDDNGVFKYLEQGFRVIGIQPNAYETGFHLIILGKDL